MRVFQFRVNRFSFRNDDNFLPWFLWSISIWWHLRACDISLIRVSVHVTDNNETKQLSAQDVESLGCCCVWTFPSLLFLFSLISSRKLCAIIIWQSKYRKKNEDCLSLISLASSISTCFVSHLLRFHLFHFDSFNLSHLCSLSYQWKRKNVHLTSRPIPSACIKSE